MKRFFSKKRIQTVILLYLAFFTAFSPILGSRFLASADSTLEIDFNVIDLATPQSIETDTQNEIPVIIENLSSQTWFATASEGSPVISLSYKLDGVLQDFKTSLNTSVPFSLATTEGQMLKLQSPSTEGIYNLEVVLVDSLNNLYEATDANKKIFQINVVSANNIFENPPSPEELENPPIDESSEPVDELPPLETTPEVTLPTGGIKVINTIGENNEVQSKEINIEINAQAADGLNISAYKFSNLQDFSDADWVNIDPQNEITWSLQKELPDVTGNYSFYVKFKDSLNNESQIYSQTVYYKKYDLTPKLTLSADSLNEDGTFNALLSGEVEITAKLTNEGSDTGYNSFIYLTLPKGFSYIESEEQIDPSFITNNEQGLQEIHFTGLSDLKSQESVEIKFKVKIGSSYDYTLGDIVEIESQAGFLKGRDFTTGFETKATLSLIIKPFIATIDPASSEALIEEEIDNKIVIEQNSEFNASSDIVVEFELANGVSYIEESQNVLINGIIVPAIFQAVEVINTNPILKWILKDVKANDLIEILFKTKINKIQENDITGPVFTDHDQIFENNLKIKDETYSQDLKQNLVSKYFKISKTASQTRVAPSDILRYTVKISVSKDYNLSGIQITDVLPDGIDLQSDILNLTSNFNVVFTSDLKNQQTGETTIIWKTLAEFVAGNTYEFSYNVKVRGDYTKTGEELLSGDLLTSKVGIVALWTDIQNQNRFAPVEERIDDDKAGITVSLPEVKFIETIKPVGAADSYTTINAKIGDIFEVESIATFPASVDTKDFKLLSYLPIGTSVVEGSFSAEIDSTNLLNSQKYEWGYLISSNNVLKASTLKLKYQIKVEDNINLKDGVVVKNFFRADYQDTNNQKHTYRNALTLNITNPVIEVSKQKVSGFLAKSEEAAIKLTLKNTGGSTAFNLSLLDIIPAKSVLVSNGSDDYEVVTSLGRELTFNSSINEFTIDNFLLLPEEEVSLIYVVKTNPEVLFGDDMSSSTRLESFSNRESGDTLVKRVTPGKTYNFKFNAVEPLLVTYFNNFTPTRNQDFELEAVVKVVGEAPVYNGKFTIDLSQASNLTSQSINEIEYRVEVNDVLKDISATSIQNGIYTFEDIDLTDKDTFKVIYSLKAPKYVKFGTSYNVTLNAEACTKLGQDVCEKELRIRKDGSDKTVNDFDNDDFSATNITITKYDSSEINGEVNFVINEKVIEITNKTFADSIIYQIFAEYEILGAQFSNDGINWQTMSSLDNLTSSQKELLDISGDWNKIEQVNPLIANNCGEEDLSCELNIEGINSRYIKVIDIQNTVTVIEGKVLKDTKTPNLSVMFISPFEEDMTDPEFTGVLENYLNIYAEDDNTSNSSSGIESYSYCIITTETLCEVSNLIDYSEWFAFANSQIASQFVTFPEVNDNSLLEAKIIVKDKAGNISEVEAYDSITYSKSIPVVELELNNGDLFTNNVRVNAELDILDTNSGVNRVRFSQYEFCDETQSTGCNMTPWTNLDRLNDNEQSFKTTLERVLNTNWVDGNKQLCVQLMDRAANVSNLSCDEITLDRVSPTGNIIIENTKDQINYLNVTLSLTAEDPILEDGTAGSGVSAFRISTIGTNCDEINDSQAKKDCEQKDWGGWIDTSLSMEIPWVLEDNAGIQTLYVQFIDNAGNKSNISYDDIIYNPFSATGNIKINGDDLFTNSKFVTLDLNVNVDFTTKPFMVRYYQTDGTSLPPAPPLVKSQEDYQKYLDTLPLGSDYWTYWELYPDYGNLLPGSNFNAQRQWDLDEGNLNRPNYGVKSVYVQYILPDYSETEVYGDSIIYAPYYGIEYLRDASWQTNIASEQIFGLGQVPGEYFAQEEFKIRLNAKNIGSFTWPKDNSNPVHITYTWEKEGKIFRGNSAILPSNILWDKTTGYIDLIISIPVFPGTYKLKIDAVHEGVAWFRDYGNISPEFQINILENPLKPTPDDSYDIPGDVLGEEDTDFGYGGNAPIPFPTDLPNCADNYSNHKIGDRCYVGGILEVSPLVQYDFMIRGQITGNPDDTRIFYFNPFSGTPYWNTLIGQEVLVEVVYQNSTNFGLPTGIRLAPKSWISEFSLAYNDSKLGSQINVNPATSFKIQPKFRNGGSGIWTNNEIFLMAIDVNGNEAASIFADSSWLSSSRVAMDKNMSGFGFNSLASFTFNINVPSTISGGDYEQCFIVTSSVPRTWARSDKLCLDIFVDGINPLPAPVFEVLPVPTGDNGYSVYIGPLPVKEGPADSFNTIANIDYGTPVQVIGETHFNDRSGGWLYVRIDKSFCSAINLTPEGNCEGWIPKGSIWHVNDPSDIAINLRPEFSKAHICGGSKEVRTGPSDNYPLADPASISQNFNFAIILNWQNSRGEKWYQIYLSQDAKNIKTGWIKGLENVCEGIFTPILTPACSGQIAYPFEQMWPVTAHHGTVNPGYPSHNGTDFGVPIGTPILASADGYISTAGPDKFTGLYIDVVHPQLGLKTRYLHLSRIDLYSGNVVKGQQIGLSGNTGYTEGPHLHFAVFDLKTGKDINPMNVLGGGSCQSPSMNNGNRTFELRGTPEDKFADQVSSNLGQPNVRLKVTNIGDNLNVEVLEKYIPAPEITYIDINDARTQVTVYGVAINKHMPLRIKIDYFGRTECKFSLPILGCLAWNYAYEYREYTDTIDHAGLEFYEDVFWPFSGYPKFGWQWNDTTDGRFVYTFNLNDANNADIDIGDKIFTQSYAWGETTFDISGIGYAVNIYVDEAKGLESGKSNVEEVVDSSIIDDFIERVKYHYDNRIGCLFGGETVETGVDCRGLALLSMREVTDKGTGSLLCDKLGNCNKNEDIPSTGADGLAKNYMPASGKKDFPYTYESENPLKGGLTIYDWHSDGIYDHVNIIYDVDSEGNRTWIYSNADCSSENHLKFVVEKDVKNVKNKILEGIELSQEEKDNLLVRIYLIDLSESEENLIIEYFKEENIYLNLIDYVENTQGVNTMWSNNILKTK